MCHHKPTQLVTASLKQANSKNTTKFSMLAPFTWSNCSKIKIAVPGKIHRKE